MKETHLRLDEPGLDERSLDEWSLDERLGPLLPLLLGRVFHVTAGDRLPLIRETGFVKTNRDGTFGDTYQRSRMSVGRKKGFVCLFDFRNATDEEIQWGLDCFPLLAPSFGDRIAFLIVSPPAYRELVLWNDIRSHELTPFLRIPEVECWFPTDMPLSAVEEVLLVEVERRTPRSPSMQHPA